MAKRGNEDEGVNLTTKRQTIQVPDDDENLNRKREIFYETGADTEFCLSDNRTIKVNKGILCFNADSHVLYQMLYGPLKDDITVISDIDSLTFRLFLDCLLDLEPYTYDVAFKIFPVAWKYQVQKSINKCLVVLEPLEVNDKLCELSNMATLFDCDPLIKKIIRFILLQYGIYKFIEDKKFSSLLEPTSLLEILRNITHKDSRLIKVIVEWGKSYLDRNNTHENIYDLFKKFEIVDFISFNYFESASALIEFGFTELGKKIFTENQITSYLREPKYLSCLSSEWKNVKQGDFFTEEIKLKTFIDKTKRVAFSYDLETNLIVVYGTHLKLSNQNFLTVDISVDGVKEPLTYRHTWMNPRKNYINFNFKRIFTCGWDSHGREEFFTVKVKYAFSVDGRVLMNDRLRDNIYNLQNFFTASISCNRVDFVSR